MKKSIIILIFLISFSSCSHTQMAIIKRNDSKIELFITKIPDRAYTEIGYIEVSGSVSLTKEDLLKILIKKAEKEGGDAVISLKYTYQFRYPCLEGVLIKYQK